MHQISDSPTLLTEINLITNLRIGNFEWRNLFLQLIFILWNLLFRFRIFRLRTFVWLYLMTHGYLKIKSIIASTDEDMDPQRRTVAKKPCFSRDRLFSSEDYPLNSNNCIQFWCTHALNINDNGNLLSENIYCMQNETFPRWQNDVSFLLSPLALDHRNMDVYLIHLKHIVRYIELLSWDRKIFINIKFITKLSMYCLVWMAKFSLH